MAGAQGRPATGTREGREARLRYDGAVTDSDPHASLRLSTSQLRWRCDLAKLAFESTDDVDPIEGVVGQEEAIEALRFGVEFAAPGQNVYVRAIPGTGRITMVESVLGEVAPKRPPGPDHCYVHNFDEPDRPRLITLPAGVGAKFRDRMDEFAQFVAEELGPALESDELRAMQAEIAEVARKKLDELTAPLEVELAQHELALMMAKEGSVIRPIIVPRIEGQPTPPSALKALRDAGKVDEAQLEQLGEQAEQFAERLEVLTRELFALQKQGREQLHAALAGTAESLLAAATSDISDEFGEPVHAFVNAVIADVLENGVPRVDPRLEPERRYGVNLISGHHGDGGAEVILENAPSVPSLLGSIVPETVGERELRADHMSVHAGSLLRADGGFLVLDARDVLVAPGAWRVLIRTLRAARIDITPGEAPTTLRAPTLTPEPIPVDVKVILVGDPSIYALLDARDDDFRNLFKVLADFESTIPNDDRALSLYAGVISRLAACEDLPAYSAAAIAALAEHGARIADSQEHLTARFGRVADLAREAAFLARRDDSSRMVTADDVIGAVRRTKRRADLPARRFREMIQRGSIRIRTEGSVVGQINGLAVTRAGPLTYGFPARITATANPGTQGVVNIEREAELSGSIHTKSFFIIGGLLRQFLNLEHPLPLDAGIAFEQSYGGIDGDSASVAMFCALLSALCGVPVRQDIAVTGALDQHGYVLPVGGTNEKIEGFFDVCMDVAPTTACGVAIPKSNCADLMLRHDLVKAADSGRFSVYAMTRIEDAIRLFMPVDGAADSVPVVLERARARAGDFWKTTRA